MDNYIEVDLSNGKKLIAARNTDRDFKEIFIGIEDEDGCWVQDLATVREEYRWEEKNGVHEYVPVPNKYEVLVYGDCNNEDWTECFKIGDYEYTES